MKSNLRENKRRGENKDAPNNSMDVRQKQRLFYDGSSEPAACLLPVFAHVISAVRHFPFAETASNNYAMRNFRNILLIFTFIIALAGVTTSLAQSSWSKRQATGTLKGLIVDPTDARIAYARLIIEGKNLKRKVKANDSGEYKIALPVGEYKVFAEMDGFHSSRPEKLRVVRDKTIEFNVTLEGIRNDVDHP